MVAGSYVQRNLDIAAVEGRVVTISLLGGARAEINVGMILMKRLTLTGSTLRSRTVAQKAAVADGRAPKRLAADRVRQSAAGHFQDFPAGRGQRSASADGVLESHRQNRANGVKLGRAPKRPGSSPSLILFPRRTCGAGSFLPPSILSLNTSIWPPCAEILKDCSSMAVTAPIRPLTCENVRAMCLRTSYTCSRL